jgi:hypothetical protein
MSQVEFLISKNNQDNSMEQIVANLKEKMRQKLEIVEKPENGKEVVIVIEEKIEKSYTAEVGFGKCWRLDPNYDIVGKVFTENTPVFVDGTIKIHTKEKYKTRKLLIGVTEPGFIRKIDEAIWDGKFKNIEDLTNIIDRLF